MISDVYMTFADEIASAVDKGENLLDTLSKSWRDRIDLDELDMPSVDMCLLAQAFGGYKEGLDFLGIDLGEPYGFDIPNTIFDDGVMLEVYDMLANEWKGRLESTT